MSVRNVVQAIIDARYAATAAQIEALAREVGEGVNAGGTYLQVLTVACQAELNAAPVKGNRKPGARKQAAVVNRINDQFYPHVLKGVGPMSMDQKERNRRATFARSAASTLRTFASEGGDIRALVPGEVSKAKLRAHGLEVPEGTRDERALARFTDATIRAAQRVTRGNPKAARQRLEAAITALRAALESMDGAKAPAQPEKRASRTAHARRAARAVPVRHPRHNGHDRAHHRPSAAEGVLHGTA